MATYENEVSIQGVITEPPLLDGNHATFVVTNTNSRKQETTFEVSVTLVDSVIDRISNGQLFTLNSTVDFTGRIVGVEAEELGGEYYPIIKVAGTKFGPPTVVNNAPTVRLSGRLVATPRVVETRVGPLTDFAMVSMSGPGTWIQVTAFGLVGKRAAECLDKGGVVGVFGNGITASAHRSDETGKVSVRLEIAALNVGPLLSDHVGDFSRATRDTGRGPVQSLEPAGVGDLSPA